MSTLRLGRFHVRTSTTAPPTRFNKMDLVRTKRAVGLDRLPTAYESLVLDHGWGSIGRRIVVLSPDDVVAETAKLRARAGAHPPPWSDPARIARTLVIATISFGDRLAWFADQDRFVRMPQETSHHASDLGSDLALAMENILHLGSAPESIDFAAPGR